MFTVRVSDSRSVAACADLCQSQRCTIAAFRPQGKTGECVLSFKKVDLPCPTTKRVTDHRSPTAVLIMCLQCGENTRLVIVSDTREDCDFAEKYATAVSGEEMPVPVQKCPDEHRLSFYATALPPSSVSMPQFKVGLCFLFSKQHS